MERQSLLRLPVDQEHGGLRVAVFGVFLVSWIIAYIVVALLVPGNGLNILALLASFAIAYGLSTVTERGLRRRWPSGREIDIDEAGVRLILRGAVEREIVADDDPADVLMWRFQTARRSRVPKGWFVLACALAHDEHYLAVYTFMSPDQLGKFARADRFTLLKSKRDSQKTTGRDDLLLAGEQRRLLQAEAQRWNHGAEVSVPDFETYLNQLYTQFPNWMP